jgi:hypothetical protein
MSDLPDRAVRAFRDHGSFDHAGDGRFDCTTTPFEAHVDASAEEDGRIRYAVEARAPSLSAAVDGDVAAVVEEGWYETFERRMADVGGVMHAEGVDPTVRLTETDLVVTAEFADIDPRRGVDDAVALINYVEGTYVQGVIPGYDYRDPVAGLLAGARRTGDT